MIIVIASIKDLMNKFCRWYQIPQACIWLNDAKIEDYDKAMEYAKKESRAMFVYNSDDQDPLGKAKRELVEQKWLNRHN